MAIHRGRWYKFQMGCPERMTRCQSTVIPFILWSHVKAWAVGADHVVDEMIYLVRPLLAC
eukprot:scaffold72210_cov15-Tisochrysis_lutea.AAC.1